ncbi:MAG: hypothetical protein AAGJ94_18105, partial [Pseudomonadota bacterium]
MNAGVASVLAMLGVAGVAAPSGGEASQLQPARWETRPLLIFTPSDTAADLSRQTTELANHAGGLTDR